MIASTLFLAEGTLPLGVAFWIVMLILLFFGWRINSTAPNGTYWGWGFSAVIWFLFFLLGWQTFGFPLGK